MIRLLLNTFSFCLTFVFLWTRSHSKSVCVHSCFSQLGAIPPLLQSECNCLIEFPLIKKNKTVNMSRAIPRKVWNHQTDYLLWLATTIMTPLQNLQPNQSSCFSFFKLVGRLNPPYREDEICGIFIAKINNNCIFKICTIKPYILEKVLAIHQNRAINIYIPVCFPCN